MALDADEVALLDLLLSQVPLRYGSVSPTFEIREGKITAVGIAVGDMTIRVTLNDVRTKLKAKSSLVA